jgi:aspartyl-tRNA(Asn)/glutamyl-tRNA(Gln) amidotransferase subunit A
VTDPYNAIVTRLDEPVQTATEGRLAGRTLLVKDLIDTAGIRTTYGSSIYADHVPELNAPAVQRLLDAGAVLVGKANLHEFAWGTTSQNPWYGTVRNPRHPGRTTGGSSGGNAAALAAGLAELGLGTDTGCSVRWPSAACGTVGLKPRWGNVPVEGVFPLCPSLDTVGPMATTVADVALMWSVLTGRAVPEPRLAGLTVGLLTHPPSVGDGNRPPANEAAEPWARRLEQLGARLVSAEIPEPEADTWPLFFREGAQSHARTFPQRADEYGENVRVKLERAVRVRDDEVGRAYRALESWRRYEPEVDLYVSPVFGHELPADDVDELELRITGTAFTRPINLLGWAGLAIGDLQLVAPHDETVLAAGLAWERELGDVPAPGGV